MSPRKKKSENPDQNPGVLNCAICRAPNAIAGSTDINGLPANVPACAECRAAIGRREVGVSINMLDGSLSITDGRVKDDEPTFDQARTLADAVSDGKEMARELSEALERPSGDDGAFTGPYLGIDRSSYETMVPAPNGPTVADTEADVMEAAEALEATDDGVPDVCGAECDGFVCDRPSGHDGEHVSHGAGSNGNDAKWSTCPDAAPVAGKANNTVAVLEADWERLMALLASVEACRSEYNQAKEDANHAKKALETAQSALERALDRMRSGKEANQEPKLPFDAPAEAPGTPEPSPEGLPYDGIHQSDVAQPEELTEAPACEAHGVMVADNENGTSWHCAACPNVWPETPEQTRHKRVLATSAWLIDKGWKHCTPEHCERYSDEDLDKLLAWASGTTGEPEVPGLTTALITE